MNIQTLRMQLHFYQRMMIIAKTAGDLVAHEVYKQITRELTEQIQDKEKTACSQQTA
ncbi:hypothetical protein NST23_18875 [Brevibacillus sp. FSL K6-0770]|uniref:Uncharacterized protein n=1 Tax=Brevibacillus fulvus TaxID=1125967 RepID=A0A938XZ84_9BACL|nr:MULTISPECIES: hypothetical protein [Brevibacillus]MBM7590919.1 hypothetical protein [Brevibacillus fulvus]MBY0052943.1 hypothetical protein [Brevibacillus agri]NRQ56075.1 hypothetical protein [Brevibacillus sp. HD1.4A]QHZ55785.1 hypothetical protein M655_009095 [Brevibacillus sp. NSP2.1]